MKSLLRKSGGGVGPPTTAASLQAMCSPASVRLPGRVGSRSALWKVTMGAPTLQNSEGTHILAFGHKYRPSVRWPRILRQWISLAGAPVAPLTLQQCFVCLIEYNRRRQPHRYAFEIAKTIAQRASRQLQRFWRSLIFLLSAPEGRSFFRLADSIYIPPRTCALRATLSGVPTLRDACCNTRAAARGFSTIALLRGSS